MIALASDHAGYALKKELEEYLRSKGYETKDFGTYSEESCDYAVYGSRSA
ncbi:MAG: RpiB/LacA/LacB family sugar-phosphate isomerase, partial [Eubacteriales bacterium]|nr:RpiB/LacA/LacB family sugar-phosphate isomerase [Eubacteriales bacterium]